MPENQTTAPRVEIVSEWQPPWRRGILACFSIVGMNHYYLGGKNLFVAMSRFDKIIKAEGPDGPALWAELERKAEDCVNGR